MTTSPQRRIANRITHPTPDVGTRTPQLRTGIAIQPVTTEIPVDADGTPTGSGYPSPGWWVLLDDLPQVLPVIAGSESGIEPGRPVWVVDVGGGRVILGGVSTIRTDWPDWDDDPVLSPIHPWIRLIKDTPESSANNTWDTIAWNGYSSSGPAWGSTGRGNVNNAMGGVGTTVLVIPFTGLWEVTVGVTFEYNTSGFRLVKVCRVGTHNGVLEETLGEQAQPATAGILFSAVINIATGPFSASTGDAINVRAFQNSGGPLDITSGRVTLTYVGPGASYALSPDPTRQARIAAVPGFITP